MKTNKNQERSERFKKFFGIAAGTSMAVFYLKNNPDQLKKMDKYLGDMSKTLKRTAKSFKALNKKDITYDNSKKIFKDNFLNKDSFYKNLSKQVDNKIAINYKNGIARDLIDYKNFKLKINKSINNEIIKTATNEVMSKTNVTHERYKDQLDIFYSKVLKNQSEFFRKANAKEAINKQFNLVKIDSSFKKATEDSLFEKDVDIISQAMQNALNQSKEISTRVTSQFEDFEEKTKEIFLKNIKAKGFKQKTVENAATINDLLFNLDKVKIKNNELNDGELFSDFLKEIVSKDKEFGKIVLDNNIRLDNEKNLFSIDNLTKLKRAVQEETADTIFGKLFNSRSLISSQNTPSAIFFEEGLYNPVLAKKMGSDDGFLKNPAIKIVDKFYEYKNKELKHLESLDNATVYSADHGSFKVIFNNIFGNRTERDKSGKLTGRLDIMTTGITSFQESLSRITKFGLESTWIRNRYSKLKNIVPTDDIDTLLEMEDNIKELNHLFNSNMRGVSSNTIEKLKDSFSSENARNLLNALLSDDYLTEIKKLPDVNFNNKDLTVLFEKYKQHPESYDEFLKIGAGEKKNLNIIRFDELFKREAVKEAMFLESKEYVTSSGLKAVTSKIERLDISGAEKDRLSKMYSWTIFQEETDTFSNFGERVFDKEKSISKAKKLNEIFNTNSENAQEEEFLTTLKNDIQSFVNDNSSIFESHTEEDNSLLKARDIGNFIVVNDEGSPLEILKRLNEAIIEDSDLKNLSKQFKAGRKDAENVSTATLISYHMVSRLTSSLEGIGLGFSSKSTGDVQTLIKSIGLKRVLPAIGGISALSYLNYESKNLTGTSLLEAYENSKANFVLGVKDIQGAFGLDSVLERSRDYNPIMSYYGGEYRDSEEYLDYLEDGYDPVRKGRFWSFGSASEFRGGKISYYTPNSLRKAHSNYFDISVYGSSDEKWKHSWIPTLRYPLSPLRALSNPYWLEEKHYWDRPYPVTGKLFGEGGPWSAPLNATIGEIIKPQKKMHKKELGKSFVDVRDIIRERNTEIFERSNENRIVRFNNSGITPMTFSPSSMPSLNEAVYSINIKNGKINNYFEGQDYAESLEEISNSTEVIPEQYETSSNSNTGTRVLAYKNIENDSIFGDMIETFSTELLSRGAFSKNESLSIIEGINKNTKAQSMSAREDGVYTENATEHTTLYKKKTEKLQHEYLFKNENITNIGTKKEQVSDMMFSAKQLSGIYGFMLDSLIPEDNSYKLAQAGSINSFSRRFWDKSVGGLGGDTMEIARRFFPHEDHNIETVNPIKNTMPEWLPESFLKGDPYTKIPEGEARLPGRGYESLNKLHPDQYGRYGAFDRFKILADVAPMSSEYKIWKQIVKDNYKTPKALQQISEIEKRAKEQNKQHDFYNYKFIGRKLKTQTAVIDKVNNDGTFTVTDGGNQVFKLAGIEPIKDVNGESYIHEYLKSGMGVQLSYEDNAYRNKNSKNQIEALVITKGESISRQMYEDKTGEEIDNKETLASEYFNLNEGNIKMGHVFEAISHAQIPYFHNKFLRIDSPMESYKKEQIYGNPFSTWNHPIKGFVQPVFQDYWARGPISQSVGLATLALSHTASNADWSKSTKTAAHTLFALTNPAGLAGGIIGSIPKLGVSTNSSKIINARNGSYIGATVGVIGYGFAHLDNPFLSIGNFAVASLALNKQFKFNTNKKAAMIGAGIGLTLSAIKNPEFSLDKLDEKYIPKDTKKKWEIEEYYDRLEYLKYTNLYKKASRLALRKEGINIENIVKQYENAREKNAKKILKLKKQKELAEKNVIDTEVKEKLLTNIDNKIYQLQNPEKDLRAGKYTKAALVYKKAADTTIYGLNNFSSQADVLRALPKYDRDFFLEFAKEKDPKERKKILKYISPYKQNALKRLWGIELDELESNKEFFSNHALPTFSWSGWNPTIDLEHVKMKTIENEGMLLSDFGMYESSKNEISAIQAPSITNMYSAPSPLSLQRDVQALMNGLALSGVTVSVEPTYTSGIQFVANITREKVYNLNNKVSGVLSSVLF